MYHQSNLYARAPMAAANGGVVGGSGNSPDVVGPQAIAQPPRPSGEEPWSGTSTGGSSTRAGGSSCPGSVSRVVDASGPLPRRGRPSSSRSSSSLFVTAFSSSSASLAKYVRKARQSSLAMSGPGFITGIGSRNLLLFALVALDARARAGAAEYCDSGPNLAPRPRRFGRCLQLPDLLAC